MVKAPQNQATYNYPYTKLIIPQELQVFTNSPKNIHLYISGYFIDPVYLPESMTTTMKVSRAKTKFLEGQPREPGPRESTSSVGSRKDLGLPTVESVTGSIMTMVEAKNKFTQTIRNKEGISNFIIEQYSSKSSPFLI